MGFGKLMVEKAHGITQSLAISSSRLSQRIREFRDWVMITAASRPSLAAAVRP